MLPISKAIQCFKKSCNFTLSSKKADDTVYNRTNILRKAEPVRQTFQLSS